MKPSRATLSSFWFAVMAAFMAAATIAPLAMVVHLQLTPL